MTADYGKVVALCGGIGGAKLALGLYRVLPPEDLIVVINTGDDFEHLGLSVSPDVDTVMYTLAGLNNVEAGWGRAGESWGFMKALGALGGETWFQLGDSDLAVHVERTRRRNLGQSLSEITADFSERLGITASLVPMSDDPVRTLVHTTEGRLPFQQYFVKLRCAPVSSGISFEGIEAARPAHKFLAALRLKDLSAVIICPSNPYLSVDPILSLPGVREAVKVCGAPVVAVSPIIKGQAVKGPTAKIMSERGLSPTAAEVARHYEGLLDGFVIDEDDGSEASRIEIPVRVTQTMMRTTSDRETLARTVLAFGRELSVRECDRIRGRKG
jgi:LPPG:FO 2-phospho-L-lactate transferase